MPPCHGCGLRDSRVCRVQGALVTGFTNIEVARYLLTHGLDSMGGVVFLDELDRKVRRALRPYRRPLGPP